MIQNNVAAIPALNYVVEREQEAVIPRVWMAVALGELGRPDEAQKICKFVFEIEPIFSTLEFARSYKSKSHVRLKDNLLAAGFPK